MDTGGKMGGQPTRDELVAIKERLRSGEIKREDLEALVRLVESVEQAAGDLRAAVVE